MKKSVTAFAPASVSNVACGFDIMGFAMEGIGDRVTVRFSQEPGVRISGVIGRADGTLLEPELNTAGPPVIALAHRCGYNGGLEVEIQKGIAPGSGIGSSAASAAAAAVACNELLLAGLSRLELVEYAIKGEEVASGATHADNIAPSLLGGFTLIRGYSPLDVIRLEPAVEVWYAVVHPAGGIETKSSRKILPTRVPLKDVVTQTGNAAGLVAGLLTGDLALVGRSLQDVIVEPARADSVPGFGETKRAALGAGALGCSISGSGPALFALATDRETAEKVGAAMGEVQKKLSIPHATYVSRIDPNGTVIVA
jgi:homoserine kinase